MVIDTSAILAMLFDEPEADEFERLVEADPVVLVSAVSRVEAAFVVEGRKGDAGRIRLNRFFELVRAEVVPVGTDQAEVACEAFRRYGKGRHPANLNFGDVFAYALAKTTGEPLLFKGDDFRLTDLSSAAPGL
ncbi:MAG TPA: type II toxin-antitoxin system VapC family toxin [Rhodospirillales bacterium]|nr:type II toxin-antitoxin system VapC family toxin [Rhodospirillales bacterium]